METTGKVGFEVRVQSSTESDVAPLRVVVVACECRRATDTALSRPHRG